jgi:hypothetical protein
MGINLLGVLTRRGTRGTIDFTQQPLVLVVNVFFGITGQLCYLRWGPKVSNLQIF